jgi:hypothetical protein
MKTFTKLFQWAMILLLSFPMSLIHGQSYYESAPGKESLIKEFQTFGIEKDLSNGGLCEETLVSISEFLQKEEPTDKLSDEQLKIIKEIIASQGLQYGISEKPVSETKSINNPDGSITVTLGTDATYNGVTIPPTPYGTYWKNFRQQYLILAYELIQLGIGPGDITQLGFEVFAVNNCSPMPNYTIRMKHTTVNALTTTFDNGLYETVWTHPNFLPVTGWNTHVFTSPFVWDGVQNILIDICSDIIPGNYTQNASVFYTATPGVNTCLRYQSDSQVACGTSLAGTNSVNRANMQITGEEMLNPPPQMPHSPSPANLSVNIPVSDTLSWMFGTNTATYDLYLDTSYPPAIKVVDNQPASNPGGYDPGTLNYSVTYYWQVVAHNANGTTNGPVWSFSTACGTIIAPFSEHFQNPVIPNCWVMFGPQNWLFTTTWPDYGAAGLQDHTGTGGSFAGVDGSGATGLTGITLETPFIDLTSLTNPQLRFYLFNNNINNADWQSLRVDLWNGTSWNDSIFFWGPADNDPDWVEVEVLLTPYNITGDIQFRFVVDKSTGSPFYDDMIIDDIFVEEAPACPKPTLLGVSNVTMSTVDLTWYSLSGLSDVEFGPAGFTPTGVPTHPNVASPLSITGLTGSTAYAFFVRDNCGGGDYSNWAGPFMFYTMPGSQALPVYEDFESNFVYFDNAPGNGVNWVINTSYYKSGLQCAHNPYGNTNHNVLHETGVLDLSSSAIVFLEFWHIAKTENNWDHCYIEISTDGGSTYSILPQSAYMGTGVYNVPLNNNPAGPAFNEMSYPEWGGTSNIPPDNATWWQHEVFDLSDYLTTNVRIRFRLHSDGSVIRFGWLIDDILIYEPAYGTLSGTVTEVFSGNPIQGAVVQAGISASAITASDGSYTLPGLLTGSWNVTCSATGFNPQSATVLIIEDQTTTQDFALTAPVFGVLPAMVNVTLQPNELLDDTLSLSNTGNGPVDWAAGVVVLNTEGSEGLFDLQFDWPVGVGGGEAGIETDGSFIYTCAWNSTNFYKYAMDGTYIGSFTCGTAGTVRDLAYDGTYFYGSAANTTVFEMDFTNGILVSTFTAPTAVRAIAYNETEDVFYANNWGTPVYKFNKSGTNLGSFNCGPVGDSYYGFAFDNYSDGAPYLWGYAQIGVTLNELVQIQLPSGTETGIYFNVGSVANVGAGIAGGLAIDNALVPGFYTIMGTAQNVNIWGLELTEAGPAWLSIEPVTGTLAPGTGEEMILHFDATDLFPGLYEAEIHFTLNPNTGAQIVPVSMLVAGFIPPVNLVVSYTCTDVDLSWEMPSGGNPDSWNIYCDGELIGNSSTMSFTDPMVMPQVEYCYQIKAVYGGEESMPTQPGCITVPMPENLIPAGLDGTANVPDPENITLTWNAPAGCLTPDGYNVYRDGTQINPELVTELTYVDELSESGLYQYQVSAVYYLGESALSSPKYIAIVITDVEENKAGVLQVFPNPATGHVYIHADNEIARIILHDHTGKIVKDEQVHTAFYSVDVSQLRRGMYFIRIETSVGFTIHKVTVH